MVQFLRRIRHSLIDQNRFLRYLAYAIGEIVLVVIGILIALMINTWWQGEKDRDYEVQVIHQLKEALQRDIYMLDMLDERTDIRESAITTVLGSIRSGETAMDSALLAAYDLTSVGVSYSFDPSIYESLKSRGLEKIRRDTIRNMVIELYEYYQPRAKQFIDVYDVDLDLNVTIRELETDLFELVPTVRPDGSQNIERRFKPGMLQDARLMRILWMNQQELEYYRYRLNGIRIRLNQAVEVLDDELRRLRL